MTCDAHLFVKFCWINITRNYDAILLFIKVGDLKAIRLFVAKIASRLLVCNSFSQRNKPRISKVMTLVGETTVIGTKNYSSIREKYGF